MTLVELIMGLLVISIGVVGVLVMFQAVGSQHGQMEFMARAAPLAHGLLEEVLSKRFDELLEMSGGWSTTLGWDTGETNRNLYDDADDFQGFSENLSGELAGYSRSATVSYTMTAWISEVGSLVPGTNWHPYKLITVTVTGPGGRTLQVQGLATTLNSQGVSSG